MSYPDGVPADATCIHFTADNGKEGDYFIWKRRVGIEKEVRVYWYAQGKDGSEDNGLDAAYQAKQWIRNGTASCPKV